MSSRSYFERAGEIGVAGTRPRHGRLARPGGVGRRLGADVHRVLPVGPVAVAHDQRHRAAERLAFADAREHLGRIGLDGHAPAAAVAALAALEVGGGDRRIDRQPRRQPLDDDDERLTVRLAGREKSQHRRQLYMMQFLPLFSRRRAPARGMRARPARAAGFLHGAASCRGTCRGCSSASSMRKTRRRRSSAPAASCAIGCRRRGAWVHAASAHVLSRAGTASVRRVDAVVARALATGRSVRTPLDGVEVRDGLDAEPGPRRRCRCAAAARRSAR